MKKIKLILNFLMVIFLLIGCSNDEEADPVTGGNPLEADFTFTNDGSTFKFTNQSESGNTYRWDFGDLGFISEEENPEHTYPIGGQLLVSLTITDENGNEGFVTKTITAPEIVIIDIEIDGDFDDWEDVEVIAENTTGDSAIQLMKVWTVGEKISFYLEGNADMLLEICQIYMNTDADETSGFLDDGDFPDFSGAELLFEGPLVNDSWGEFFAQDAGESGWSFNNSVADASTLNVSAIGDAPGEGMKAVEFTLDKSALGLTGDYLGVGFVELTEGYSTVSTIPGDGSYVRIDL
ncbi:PKD domain-containing protein [Pricia antarctica]|uniref:PKD domain-containing protein n=1 Tax=Pricia antarctica TaxID=641691 RepID=A0A1G7HUH9_9FLAO|nr:PKD domain-containing protein [Pricia antarctica]SDF04112.1 PKD domain-containing protein [Pricia antarctica]